MRFLDADALEEGLPDILDSPKDEGVVTMIVRRPDTGEREVVDWGELDVAQGLVGDNWRSRGSRMMDDGLAHPQMQLNLMNSRVIALVAGSEDRWALAGDQFFVDLDLAKENLPAGTRLAMGSAISVRQGMKLRAGIHFPRNTTATNYLSWLSLFPRRL